MHGHSSKSHKHDKNRKHHKRRHGNSPEEKIPKIESDICYGYNISKWEKNSPSHIQMKIKSEDPSMPRSPSHYYHKRRLQNPIILKDEPERSHRSVRSPVILDEDGRNGTEQYRMESSSHNANFGRSGLLNKSNGSYKKQTSNFKLSGKLAEDTNTFKGVVIKYNEPEDAKKPTEHWRLYAFKGKKLLSILHIHRQSGFLIGRDRNIADLPMDHPSISKQHAALQYRFVRGMIRLYVIDLESINGTFLNNNRVESRRYYELLEKDVIKFGFSTREYVVMTVYTDENPDDDDGDDDL